MQDCAIVVAPHWYKGGSNNIFAAQIAYYKNKGWDTILVLIPDFRWRRSLRAVIHSELKADHVSTISLSPFATKLRYRISKNVLKNHVHGTIHRNFMTREGALSEPARKFLSGKRLREICVNWCEYVDFAVNVKNAIGAHDAKIVVHTHDIMATHDLEMMAGKGIATTDAMRTRLVNLELQWLGMADLIVHVSDHDADYFAKLLNKPQVTSYITLDPETERRLASFQHRPRADAVLYVASWNVANPPGIEWFVKQAVPFVDRRVQFYFAGNICDYVASALSDQIARHENIHLLGRVDDLSELYECAQAVILPATQGTGASVKFVEALAMGVPMATTSRSLRGLAAEVTSAMAPFTADRPIEFADKLSAILSGQAPKADFRAMYWTHFSNEAWRRRLDGATGASA
jgi:polysaccharide biosynthesis protein PslH